MPCEVLEQLLLWLDVRSLARCRRLNSSWRCMVDRLQDMPGYWQAVCRQTVAADHMMEISAGRVRGAETDAPQSDADWRGIFLAWARTGTVGRLPAVSRSLALGDSVTCLQLSGSFLVTGHASGLRRVWDLEQEGEGRSCVLRHQAPVSGLQLVDLLGRPPYHSGLVHHAMVTGGMDGHVLLSVLLDQYCPPHRTEQEVRVTHRRHRGPVLSLAGLQDLVAVLGVGNTVVVWRLLPPATELRLPGVECALVVAGPHQHLASLQLWPNNLVAGLLKLVALDSGGQAWVHPVGELVGAASWESSREVTLVRPVTREESLATASGVMRIKSSNLSEHSLDVVLLARDHPDWLDTTAMKVSKCWLARDNLFILASTDQDLFISVDGSYYRHYSPLVELGASVVTAAVYLDLLVLATDKSQLLVFQLKDRVEALRLDLRHPVWRGEVEGCVKKLQLSQALGRLALVVVTDRGNFFTTWQSAEASEGPDEQTDSFGLELD